MRVINLKAAETNQSDDSRAGVRARELSDSISVRSEWSIKSIGKCFYQPERLIIPGSIKCTGANRQA